MARLTLSLLGPMQVYLDGQVVVIRDNKVRALLAYLAVESERTHRRDDLAALLWPDLDQPLRNLTNALTVLRKSIKNDTANPPFLIEQRDCLQFNRDSDYTLDVDEFNAYLNACEQHVHRHLTGCRLCAHRLEQAVALYRGEFFDGLTLRDAEDFNGWMLLKQQEFWPHAVQALADLAMHYEQRRKYNLAATYTRRQIALHEEDEEAHHRLIHVLALNEQVSAALAHAEQWLDTLHHKGWEPNPATVSLVEQMRHGQLPPPLGGQLVNFPAQLTPFIGREDELKKLAELLENPTHRLITLVGPGGIGKTRLASQAAIDQTGMFADGVYFVPCAPLQGSEFLVSTIAEAIKFTFEGPVAPREQLLRYLENKELLLVLDNLEHLLEGGPVLTDILQVASGVTILATSRERLHLKGEEPVPVEGLQVPEEDLIAKTQDYSAVQLFLDGARRVRSGIDLAVADIPYVIQLCRLVEGMPLAIELMVDWVGELSCAEIVQEIERGLLMTGQPLEVGRQPGLQVVFDRSWRLLTPKDQEVFRRLSVFRGGFDQEAAEQVAGAMRLQLATLVRKSLLRRNGGGRYDMHEVIRQYAHDRLQEAGETDEIEDRHLEYYLTWTEHAHAHLSGAQQLAWTARFEAEHDNLRAALARSQATVRNVDSGLQLAANLLLFWYFRGHWYEGRRWAEGMLRRAGASGHRMARGGNLLIVGTFAWLQGDFTAAYAPLEESVQLLQATGDAKALAFAKASLGYAKMFEGDNGSAYKHFEESAVLSRKLGDDWRLGLAVNGLGDAALRQGDYLRAREHLIEALKLSQKFEKTSAAAHVLNSLGKLDLLQGDYELAHAHLTESVALGQMNDNKRFTAMALCNLGRVEHRRGNYDQAVRRYRESLRLYKEVGEKSGIAECFEGLAGVAGSQGEPEHAARLYGAAEALRDRIGVPIPPVDRFEYDRNVASARAQLDEATWLALWNGGRGMSLE